MQEQLFIEKEEGIKIQKENIDILRKNILVLLNQKKISRSELSRRIDKNNFFVNYVLNDPLPNPSTDGLGKIAHALGVQLYELFKPSTNNP